MGKIKVKVNIYDRTAVLELMENFFHDCGENGVSDFKTWCEDNVTENQEAIVENIADAVDRIAYKLYEQEGVYQMEILKMTERKTVVIQTVEKEEHNTFDIGKIRVSALPPIAKRDLIAELKCKGFCDGMIHTAMQCKLEDLNGYVNVWKYVAYMLAVELMERLQKGAGNYDSKK